jgi:hypothetical protein
MKYTYIEALSLSFPEVSWKLIDPNAPEEENFSLTEIIYPDCFKVITGTLPSKSVLDAEVTRLQAVYDSQAYARNRKEEYDLLNQDEMRYDDTKNSTTTWVDAIDAIKTKYPKP